MKPSVLNSAVRRALEGGSLPAPGEALVCALSGGPDSVALLDALAALARRSGFRLVAAHLDHGLREASAADAAFCAALCERLGVPIHSGWADVRGRARRERTGIEEAARRERYAFLRRVKQQTGAVAIAVAHTRDDQAETFLMRLLRGSGTAGLAAMRPRSLDLIRPLLAVTRQDVLEHLSLRGLDFREDETNLDTSFTRNRVRRELIPYLERSFNPRVRGALARAAEHAAAEADWLAELVPAAPAEADGSVVLKAAALATAPEALGRLRVRRALEAAGGLRGISALHVERVLRLARRPHASGRSLALPGKRSASLSFDRLRIGPRCEPAGQYEIPLSVPGRVRLPGGLALVAEPAAPPAASHQEGAVVAAPSGPLVVRTRRPGDRVRVGGRAQSLKRYLIARRVPLEERGRLPLVAAGSDVVWMRGQALQGAGDRYLSLHLEPA